MHGYESSKKPLAATAQHIAIVGAGVMGCSLAYTLSQKHQVTVLEAGELSAQGASSLPLALLNPLRGRSARVKPIDIAGLAALHRLARDKPAISQGALFFPGVLRIASSARQAKAWRKRIAAYPQLQLDWLEPTQLPHPYHAPFGALCVKGGGYVLPRRYLGRLLRAAQHQGAQLRSQCRVLAIDAVGAHTIRLECTTTSLQVDHVVLCVGADPQGLALCPQGNQGVTRLAGDILSLYPTSAVQLPQPIAAAVYAAQHQEQVYLGGSHRAPGHSTGREEVARLRAALQWCVPELVHVPLQSQWTGVRCKTDDALPRVYSVTPHLHGITGLAGRGFLCALYLAEQMAQVF